MATAASAAAGGSSLAGAAGAGAAGAGAAGAGAAGAGASGAAGAGVAAGAGAAGAAGAGAAGGSFLSKLNPITALKSAITNGGGIKSVLGNALKGSMLNTLITAVMGVMDFNSLMANPVDENGKLLGKKELSRRAGQIVLGSVGGILGGVLGAAVGGPIGSMVGSFGGQWLTSKLADSFPDFGSAVGEIFVPQAKLDAAPALADGGLVTQTGMAKVDAGEVYLGANSLQILKDLVTETRQQNQYLQALVSKNTNISMDGQAVAGLVARNVITSYGNLLNPSSATYA
jgi:hypothetical protein